MSGSVLKCLASHLFHCLQEPYWDRENWTELKPAVEKVAQCISGYTAYLEKSCKKVMLNQSTTSPVREISDNLTFQFLPRCSTCCSIVKNLCNQLEKTTEYEYVAIEDYCPAEPSTKHCFFQRLKTSGFPFAAALLTYAHGNNVGNLNFVWKVHATDETAFSTSQPVIESVKQAIPVFHTRAMRKTMFEKFGCLTSTVKPTVMRHIYRSLTGKSVSYSLCSV